MSECSDTDDQLRSLIEQMMRVMASATPSELNLLMLKISAIYIDMLRFAESSGSSPDLNDRGGFIVLREKELDSLDSLLLGIKQQILGFHPASSIVLAISHGKEFRSLFEETTKKHVEELKRLAEKDVSLEIKITDRNGQ